MGTTNDRTWFDLSIKHYGTSEGVFELCKANNASITSPPPDEYIVPEYAFKNQVVLDKLAEAAIDPATAHPELLIGIGYWQIGIDFQIS